MKKQQSILSDSRLAKAVKTMDQFCNAVYEFPLLVKGKSGSGKTHFVTSYLNERNIPFLFLTVPDHKDYFEFVSESLTRYESALKEHAEQALEQSEKQDYVKAVKESQCPFVVIDESHQLGINPEEFQHEKKAYSFDGVEVPYSRLILISHASLGKNNSENNRLKKIVIPTPTREEIMGTLVQDGMDKKQALWSVTHSPCNFHSVIEASKDFGTELQESYNPRGLESDAIDCLSFYFHSDPNIIRVYSDQFKFSKLGVNTIGNCVANLGLDKKAILESEAILKEENLLVTGEQSKRIIVTSDKSLKLTIAILKASNKLEFIDSEPKQPTPPKEKTTAKPMAKQPSKEKATPTSEAKPKEKTKGKTPTKSKFDNVRPAQTPAQIMADIHSDIDSKRVPSYYDDMTTDDLTNAI
jgi:glutaredoxin